MSLFCPIDAEQWHAQNTLPLFPRRVNRWVLVTTVFGEPPTTAQLQERASTMFALWFGGNKPVGTSNPLIVSRQVIPSWGKPVMTMRDTIPNPQMSGSEQMVLYGVEFTPGGEPGTKLDMSWPTFNRNPLKGRDCPFAIDDGVFAVYPAGSTSEAPTDLGEQLSQEAQEALDNITDPVVDVLRAAKEAAEEAGRLFAQLAIGAAAIAGIVFLSNLKGR